MGMYDHLRTEIDLPENKHGADYVFQTKDLECDLKDYVIAKDGRLYEEHWKYVFNEATGMWDRVKESHHRVFFNYTGRLDFYGTASVYYVTCFKNGILTKLEHFNL